MQSIYGITRKKLEAYFEEIGDKKFRATQIYKWLYRNKVKSFDEMTNLKKDLIEKLKEDFTFDDIKLVIKQEDELTSKYLFELNDKHRIEAVLMRHDYGNSIVFHLK